MMFKLKNGRVKIVRQQSPREMVKLPQKENLGYLDRKV